MSELPADVWERRDEPDVRDLIVLSNWPLLTRVVGRLRQGLPPHVRVDEDDLRSYGLIGLYKALDRYDPTLGHAFDKFASGIIWGAVHDALREQDWAPRSLRKRQKDMESGKRKLLRELGRMPADEELAEELRWTVHDVQTTRHQVDASWPRSLDEIRGEADRDMYSVIADAQGSTEEIALGSSESHENDRSSLLTDKVASYIGTMEPQRRAVVVFCYYLEMSHADTAALLGLPEQKVKEIHKGTLDDIHRQLENLLRG